MPPAGRPPGPPPSPPASAPSPLSHKPAKAERAPTARALAEASAREGNMPLPPNFSAATHKRFLKRHGELIAMAEAGDLRGLRAFRINPISSSPKALDRYRNLAVLALEARAKSARAAAKA